MNKKDEIKNYYEVIDKGLQKKPKLDKNFNKHYILPNSMIMCIGGTGSGKTNALMDFLSRKTNAFYDIIIYTGSTADEPLYNFLQSKIPDLKMYTDISELPELKEFDNDEKSKEKLIVFDDFINLSKKQMVKINEYLTSGRKLGFTVWLMAQSYTSVPKIIIRNCNYFIIFKLNDNNITINNIIRNHNIFNVPKELFKEIYIHATSEPRNFLLVDLKSNDRDKYLRNNFLNFIKV